MQIEVYTSALSVTAGDTVAVHVSTKFPFYTIEIEREGPAPVVVFRREDIAGRYFETPANASEEGCRWPSALNIEIPDAWRSGFYYVRAIADGEEALAFIVVRAALPTSKILLVIATNTYNAYNDYGGMSLYAGKEHPGYSADAASKVSFLRPWGRGFCSKPDDAPYRIASVEGSGLFVASGWGASNGFSPYAWSAGWHSYERHMALWLEKNGYEVDFAVSSDLEIRPDLLRRYKLMLSVGHDEYWSWRMRDAVEDFINDGGNVCFFSGNTCYWQVRFEDGGNTLVCFKQNYKNDPVFNTGNRHLTTTFWMNHVIGRPETRLTGQSSVFGGYARMLGASPNGAGGYLVYRPDHWVFEGTGLFYGDLLGGHDKIVAFEVDGCPMTLENGIPKPASFYDGPKSVEILGLAPAAHWTEETDPADILAPTDTGLSFLEEYAGDIFGNATPESVARISHNHATMAIYRKNGTVFSAGTTDWVYGLTGHDPAVERVTRNLLDRLGR
jgi:hypothetical protein